MVSLGISRRSRTCRSLSHRIVIEKMASRLSRGSARGHHREIPTITASDGYRTIVLDIDETLVHTFADDEIDWKLLKQILERPEHSHIKWRMYRIDDKMWGIRRPGLESFIDYCFRHFDNVMVWTAGTESYAESIIKSIFYKREPVAVLSRDHCEYYDKDRSKPLEKIVDGYPELGLTMDDVLTVDDNKRAFKWNKENAIHIPEYDPPFTIEGLNMKDHALKDVTDWLDRHSEYHSFIEMPKEGIFR